MNDENVLHMEINIQYSCTLVCYVHLVPCKAVETQVWGLCLLHSVPRGASGVCLSMFLWHRTYFQMIQQKFVLIYFV